MLIPNAEQIELINQVIFDELCLGQINPSSRAKFQQIIDSLKQQSAEGVILGCTEIGLLISQQDSVLPIFDTTVIHAHTAAKLALEQN